MFCTNCRKFIEGGTVCAACGTSVAIRGDRPVAYTSPPNYAAPNMHQPRMALASSPPPRQLPYPPPVHHIPQPAPHPISVPVPQQSPARPDGRRMAAFIAILVALIILAMQMNWIVVHVDVGRMSNYLLADIISQEDALNAMRDAGIIGPYENDINNLPGLAHTITALQYAVEREIQGFFNNIHGYNLQDILTGLLADPPDIVGIISLFPDLMQLEAVRVAENTGELSLSISISDIPNLISLTTFITDMVTREGEGWGITHETMRAFNQNTAHIQTAEQYVLILRIVFAAVALLLIIFMYLLVAGARPACAIGMLCLFIALLLPVAFVVAEHCTNDILSETIGGFVQVSAGWYVYATIGLSVLAFIFTAIHGRTVRRNARG